MKRASFRIALRLLAPHVWGMMRLLISLSSPQSLLFLLTSSKPNHNSDASNERNAEIARLLITAGANVYAKLATPEP